MPKKKPLPIVVNEEFLNQVEKSWAVGGHSTGRVIMALVQHIRKLEDRLYEEDEHR